MPSNIGSFSTIVVAGCLAGMLFGLARPPVAAVVATEMTNQIQFDILTLFI